MSWPSRLRKIALSQLKAIKDRLDRIDAEMLEDRLREYQARADAERELAEDLAGRVPPIQATSPSGQKETSPTEQAQEQASQLTRYYRILGVPVGSGLAEVEAAYRQLLERCASLDAEEGSDEHQMVAEIRARVDDAYNALREALNPAAGRFDKLEFE